MTTYVALLRAVNVGGTGRLPMSDLRDMAAAAGFHDARTHLASGNLVFRSDADAGEVKARLEEALEEYAGKPVGVLLRTAAEMRDVVAANPFPDRAPNRTVVVFLDDAPPADLDARGAADEEVHAAGREIWIHFPGGQGRSKLRIPAAAAGTRRNVNTVTALAQIASELERDG